MQQSLLDLTNETLKEVADFLYSEAGKAIANQEIDDLWNFYELFPQYLEATIDGRCSAQQSLEFDLEKTVVDNCVKAKSTLKRVKAIK